MTISLLLSLVLAADPDWARHADSFRENTLEKYEVKGAVTWQAGQVTVGPGYELSRRGALSYRTAVQVNVALPGGQSEAELVVRFQGKNAKAEAALVLHQGLLVLHNRLTPGDRVALNQAGEQVETAWIVRCEFRHDLLHAKAWAASRPEPEAWQTIRYANAFAHDPLWDPVAVTLAGGAKAGATVTSLEIAHGAERPLPPEQQQKIDRAQALYDQVRPLFVNGKLREALALALEVLPIQQSVYGPQHPDITETLLWIAAVLREQGKLREALPYFEQALAGDRRFYGAEHPKAAESAVQLGDLFLLIQEQSRGRKYREEALAICKKVFGPSHAETSSSLISLCVLLHESGDHVGSRRYLEEALASEDGSSSPRDRHAVPRLNNLSHALMLHGDMVRAERYDQRALSIAREVFPAEHPMTATCMNNLAVGYLKRGEYAAARSLLEEIVILQKKVYGSESRALVYALANLASMHRVQGNDAAARAHCEEALAVARGVYGSAHPYSTKLQHDFGMCLARDRNLSAAWEHLSGSALTTAQLTDRILLANAERQHANILRDARYGLEDLLTLAEQAPDLARRHADTLLAVVLRWKGSAGQAVLARQEALAASRAPDLAPLLDDLRLARHRLVQAIFLGPGRLSGKDYQTGLDRLRARQDDLERQVAGRLDGLADLQSATQADPNVLRSRLETGSALVELVRYRQRDFRAKPTAVEWLPPRYAALVLQRPGAGAELSCQFVPLGEAKPIDNAIRAWRSATERGSADVGAEKALGASIWEPIVRVLPTATRRWYVAPDGELALLPWEALRLADGRFVVEDYQISYLSTGRDLMPRGRIASGPASAIVLYDPDYDADASVATPAQSKSLARVDSRRSADLEHRGIRFRSLPGFGREAEALARAWRAALPNAPLQLLSGRDGSEEKLATLNRPRLLYLITHGFFLPDLKLLDPDPAEATRNFEVVSLGTGMPSLPGSGEDPQLRSGLALAGANRWQARSEKGLSDGLLTAREVHELDLWGTELVVLSACETGLGLVSDVGEGVLGLRRAFQHAGARTVLASLWKVPDRETEQLMTLFFERWLQGTPKARAFRSAQLALLAELRVAPDAKRRAGAPLYWAGFICHGQAE